MCNVDFGEWLRQQRRRHGWSQDELAERVGVSKTYISVIERCKPHSVTGARPTPAAPTLLAIAHALGVTPREVFARAYGFETIQATSEEEERRKLADEIAARLQGHPADEVAVAAVSNRDRRLMDMVKAAEEAICGLESELRRCRCA